MDSRRDGLAVDRRAADATAVDRLLAKVVGSTLRPHPNEAVLDDDAIPLAALADPVAHRHPA